MYLNKSIPLFIVEIHGLTLKWSQTKKLSFAAIMASLAGILQSMGGILPGVGFFFSPFATLPIFLSMLVSFRLGFLSFLTAIGLLLVIRPDELVIFPFTTGLLGMGLGWTFRSLRKYLSVLLINSVILFLGICIPFYVIDFPVFGPSVSSTFDISVITIILLFSLIYSLVWVIFGPYLIRELGLIKLFRK